MRVLALTVVRRIAEAVEKIARLAGREPVALLGITGHERSIVIDVLDEVIAKPPFPDQRALTVDLDDHVHLRAVVALGGIRVRTECDHLVMRQPRISDIEDRVVIKLGVIDAQKIMMGVVSRAPLGVLLERLTFPVPNGERFVAYRPETKPTDGFVSLVLICFAPVYSWDVI